MNDTIHLYGDIGVSYWFEGYDENDLLAALRELDSSADAHHIRINSPGGFVDVGLAMMNVLRVHKQTMKAIRPEFKLKTYVDGYCMSAATCPFMAGDERIIAVGGVVMIHDAWSWEGGNAEALRATADRLDKLSNNCAEVYATLCTPAPEKEPVRNAEFFRELMKKETYLIGDESLNIGLSTQVDSGHEAVLITELSPENLKGHYVQYMTSRKTKTVFQKAKNRKLSESLASLETLATELGLEFPKSKA